MIFIGIDPGKSGALAAIGTGENSHTITTIKFKEYAYRDYIRNLMMAMDESPRVYCVVEKVHAMPGQGVTSMFSFGENYGNIRGILESFFIPYELVDPRTWKKEFHLGRDKQDSILAAKALFPGVNLKSTERSTKDSDGIAEALLMAEYARRSYSGKLKN